MFKRDLLYFRLKSMFCVCMYFGLLCLKDFLKINTISMFPKTLFFEFCSTVPFKQLEKLSSTYTYMAEKEILGPQAHQGRPKGAIIVRRRVCLVSLYALKI